MIMGRFGQILPTLTHDHGSRRPMGRRSSTRTGARASRGSSASSGPLSARLVQNGTLKTYHGFPHGMPTTQAETINADLLTFVQS
jgi:hypothetical protein